MQSYPQKTALFLSTPSARRATRIENKPVWRSHNFYPRPPRGGRPQKHVQMGVKRVISIHALREEGDDEPEGLTNKKTISIHALREEGDLVHLFRAVSGFDFYPRPPRGGRPVAGHQPPHPPPFLSTPSARRATSNLFYSVYVELDFYPRPPRGGRHTSFLSIFCINNFYPRPPRGGRLANIGEQAILNKISIHALREEGDRTTMGSVQPLVNFYPRPPRGGRRRLLGPAAPGRTFLSTPSARRATLMSVRVLLIR